MSEQGEIRLDCWISPEKPSWAYRCGVFFDVVNKTDRTILVTGLNAGACGGDKEAKLYACTRGSAVGRETDDTAWKVLWSGVLKHRAATPVSLNVLLPLPANATQGLLLVSDDYAVYHTTREDPVEDENIMLCAGVRSTEHKGNIGPFDPSGHSKSEKATHAGSISYIFGKSYIVMCNTGETDSDGNVNVACTNMAGSELAVVSIKGTDSVAMLRSSIATALSSQLSESASLQIELVGPDGKMMSNETCIAEAFPDK